MTFDVDTKVHFNLNTYATKYDVLNAFTPHYSSVDSPDYTKALEVAKNMFTVAKGDRVSGVIAIVNVIRR